MSNSSAPPQHLLLMVNGIIGSANNWKYAAGQFKLKLGDKVQIHCSSCNPLSSTFDGVDVMGLRLAEEVRSIVKEAPELKKISFLAHSLGGLVARYAIGQLLSGPNEGIESLINGRIQEDGSKQSGVVTPQVKGTLAGLQAVNFITVATPHIGSRGNKQLPFLFGFSFLEQLAPQIAHWFVGKTGKHLFLADGEMPLLWRMVQDSEEGCFLSALKLFRYRVAYSNVCFDHMVGWRTSSIRRECEMPEVRNIPLDEKYPHIMRVDDLSGHEASVNQEKFPAQDPIEEEMILGLRQVPWRVVDVNFHGSHQRLLAHSAIQVENYWLQSDGADVIAHIIDNFEA